MDISGVQSRPVTYQHWAGSFGIYEASSHYANNAASALAEDAVDVTTDDTVQACVGDIPNGRYWQVGADRTKTAACTLG